MSGGVPAGELLPCPFCGKDEYLSNGGTACHFAVVCIGCDSEGPWIEYDQSQQGDFERAVAEAHTAWNTRTTPTPPIEGRDADVERVARALCEYQIRQARRWDTDADELEAMLPAAIEHAWEGFTPPARAALQALGERG